MKIKLSYKNWAAIGNNTGWLKEAAKIEEGGPDAGDIFGDPDTELDSKGRLAPFAPSKAEAIEFAGWYPTVLKDRELGNVITEWIHRATSLIVISKKLKPAAISNIIEYSLKESLSSMCERYGDEGKIDCEKMGEVEIKDLNNVELKVDSSVDFNMLRQKAADSLKRELEKHFKESRGFE
jgi:hypothetical protein